MALVTDVKVCSRCGEEKPLGEYHRRASSSDGLNAACKDCNCAAVASWRAANPSKARNIQLRSKYGITLDEYEGILEYQEGVCAICRDVCATGQELAVDHCHDTGSVRGLLCQACNLGIGNLRHDPDVLDLAVRYLVRSRDLWHW